MVKWLKSLVKIGSVHIKIHLCIEIRKILSLYTKILSQNINQGGGSMKKTFFPGIKVER